MAKIRDDLVGVVYLKDGRKLAAGDTVPDGVELGEHVLAKTRARAAKDDGDAKSEPGKSDGDNAARNSR